MTQIHPLPVSVFLENLSSPETGGKDPGLRVAAASGIQSYSNRAAFFLPRAPESFSSVERKPGLGSLAKHRASSENPMCVRLKVGRPGPQHKLKETGLLPKTKQRPTGALLSLFLPLPLPSSPSLSLLSLPLSLEPPENGFFRKVVFLASEVQHGFLSSSFSW